MITSKDNARIRHIRKLMTRPRARREEGLFILEGVKPVTEALSMGLVRELYLSEEDPEKWAALIGLSDLSHVPVTHVSAPVFSAISDTVSPQGVLAVVEKPVWDKQAILQKEKARLLILEDVRDPGNIGTMIRTAEGAGWDGILLSSGCADVYQPKVLRSTMGSILRVPCLETGSHFSEEIKVLKEYGFTLYAAHLQGTVDYREPAYEGRIGVLIGNEASGLSDDVSRLADCLVRIPMKGKLESLNAAVSAALMMYEAI